MVLLTNLESQESNTDPVEPYLRPPKSQNSNTYVDYICKINIPYVTVYLMSAYLVPSPHPFSESCRKRFFF